VEQKCTIANGYNRDAKVVHGDIISVQVKLGTSPVQDIFPLADEAADKCSEISPNPIPIERFTFLIS
jgi:hypothetical protein